MDSFMYSSSSKGIVSQALTGAGTEFKRLSEVLVNRHGALDSGVGRCYLAGLYNIAPWPIGDKKRALQEVLLSLGRHPGSRRNNYSAQPKCIVVEKCIWRNGQINLGSQSWSSLGRGKFKFQSTCKFSRARRR
jgi:hypothetical protein